MPTLLSINFELSATNIIGALLLVASVLMLCIPSKICKIFTKDDYVSTEHMNIIRLISLFIAIAGAILIINY